ncbi:MAG: hypothetical protein K0Q50_1655 [Vampirovibrio sp.]|jgi:hypothetical protein|nr:hypothetical protein [Vampirovibrio sp.]
MKSNKGVSLTEYGLIAGIISLVVLPVLFTLGQKISQYASETVPYEKKTFISGKNSVMSDVPPSEEYSKGLVTKITNAPSVVLTTQQVGQTVATMGANGTTKMLADSIVKSAEQQLAAGSITQAQYNKLIVLAKEGYNLASLQGAVETAAAKLRRGENIKSIDIQVNGRSMTVEDIWEKIGYDNKPESVPTDISQLTGEPRVALQDFLDAYASAEKSGVLRDPALKTYISSLSTQIV